MKDLIKSKKFIVGFLLTFFFFFFVITPYYNEIRKGGISMSFNQYGFPFVQYVTDCWSTEVVWSGLAANIIIASLLSIGVGLSVAAVGKKITERTFKSK